MGSSTTDTQTTTIWNELDTGRAWVAFALRGMAALTERVTLRDGAGILLRAIRPDDDARLRGFHSRLSVETIVQRYFRVAPTLLERDARRLTHLDYDRRMAIVATAGEGEEERIIGDVRYEPISATVGELAFVVEDIWQGRGVSTRALARLLRYARERGYTRMTAVTMAGNVRMRSVLSHAGYPCELRYEDGVLLMTLDITAEPACA